MGLSTRTSEKPEYTYHEGRTTKGNVSADLRVKRRSVRRKMDMRAAICIFFVAPGVISCAPILVQMTRLLVNASPRITHPGALSTTLLIRTGRRRDPPYSGNSSVMPNK